MGRIRTWRVGEVGVEGTRRVEEGGIVRIGGKLADGTHVFRRYHLDRLLALVGEIVHFHDDDDMRGGIMLYRCGFETTRGKKERLIIGPVLGRAFEVRDEKRSR